MVVHTNAVHDCQRQYQLPPGTNKLTSDAVFPTSPQVASLEGPVSIDHACSSKPWVVLAVGPTILVLEVGADGVLSACAARKTPAHVSALTVIAPHTPGGSVYIALACWGDQILQV
jgi:hypothetical protein